MFRTKPATERRTTQPSPCQTGRTKRASACKVRPSTQSRQLHKFNRTRRPLFVRSDARTNHHQISPSKSERERTTRSSIGRTRSHLWLSRSTRHRTERVDTARVLSPLAVRAALTRRARGYCPQTRLPSRGGSEGFARFTVVAAQSMTRQLIAGSRARGQQSSRPPSVHPTPRPLFDVTSEGRRVLRAARTAFVPPLITTSP